MIPITDLINKIKWDKRELASDYKMGYWDNVKKEIIFIDFEQMIFEEGNKFSFSYIDEQGRHEIPFHRIRKVVKKGRVVWERK